MNNITVKYRHSIPRLDDMLDECHGSCMFSKIYLKSGFHQTNLSIKFSFKLHLKLNMVCISD